jgi:hypothetical protein
MKYSILSVILIFCHSCKNSPFPGLFTKDLKKVEITLIDSLSKITVNVPVRYDTAFSWIHYSDCNTCHVQKYRIQSKGTPIVKESGFYWDRPGDSVDRLTISHNHYLPGYVNDTTNLGIHSLFKDDLKYTRRGMKILKDTIQKINDRYFSIFELQSSDSVIRKEVFAITTINGNFLNFSCELVRRKENSITRAFFINSANLVNSIIVKSVKKS